MAQKGDPRYPGKDFPDYEFQEFPKYLGENAYGQSVIAEDAADEDIKKKLVVKKTGDAEAPKPVQQPAPASPKPSFKP